MLRDLVVTKTSEESEVTDRSDERRVELSDDVLELELLDPGAARS
jgi:hypothetical protein